MGVRIDQHCVRTDAPGGQALPDARPHPLGARRASRFGLTTSNDTAVVYFLNGSVTVLLANPRQNRTSLGRLALVMIERSLTSHLDEIDLALHWCL